MSVATLKAIETHYKGYRFRSRLEARWAVYFDAIGIQWEYEKEGYDLDGLWYLPDFWLPQVSMWAEVKPEKFDEPEMEKARRLADSSGYPVLMLVGTPSAIAYWSVEPRPDEPGESWAETWDYILDGMYLDEHRFFASTGLDEGEALDPRCHQQVHRAVNASRSARFGR
jgi:hypothetical protein